MHVMLGEIRLAIFIDVHMISYVVCSSERTLSTKMTATLFSEPAQQNAQHSCAFARKILWQIMLSLLNSEGAGHGLPDGLVEVWDNKISGMTFVNLSRSAPPAAAAASTQCPL